MVKPGMNGAGIDEMSKSHLVYIAKTLIVWMRNNLEDQRVINSNKTIHGVVDDLADLLHCCFFVKGRAAKVQRQVVKS